MAQTRLVCCHYGIYLLVIYLFIYLFIYLLVIFVLPPLMTCFASTVEAWAAATCYNS